MGLAQEFKEFAIKGNVIDMAVGLVITGVAALATVMLATTNDAATAAATLGNGKMLTSLGVAQDLRELRAHERVVVCDEHPRGLPLRRVGHHAVLPGGVVPGPTLVGTRSGRPAPTPSGGVGAPTIRRSPAVPAGARRGERRALVP